MVAVPFSMLAAGARLFRPAFKPPGFTILALVTDEFLTIGFRIWILPWLGVGGNDLWTLAYLELVKGTVGIGGETGPPMVGRWLLLMFRLLKFRPLLGVPGTLAPLIELIPLCILPLLGLAGNAGGFMPTFVGLEATPVILLGKMLPVFGPGGGGTGKSSSSAIQSVGGGGKGIGKLLEVWLSATEVRLAVADCRAVRAF